MLWTSVVWYSKGFIRIGCTVVLTWRDVSEHEIIYCKFIILDELIRTTFVVVPICGPVQSLGTPAAALSVPWTPRLRAWFSHNRPAAQLTYFSVMPYIYCTFMWYKWFWNKNWSRYWLWRNIDVASCAGIRSWRISSSRIASWQTLFSLQIRLDFLLIAHCSTLDFPELLKISYIFTWLGPLNVKIDMGSGIFKIMCR